MNRLKLIDQVIIDQPIRPDLKSDALDLLAKGKAKLKIQVDVTHSGLLTNLRVYPGKHVKTSWTSFLSKENGGTSDYNAPVLRHHKDEEDPIGRAVAGQYIQFKQGDAFDKDYRNPEIEGRGSGVVRLDADITDPDAAQKIIDGRYLSVSSGHMPKYLLCSICHDHLVSRDGTACEHLPGKSYELNDSEHMCYGITGPLRYREFSIVNAPGQSPAKILNFDWELAKHEDSDGLLIPSSVRGKKSMVTSLSLIDEDIELDLLLGRDKSTRGAVLISVPESVTKSINSSFEESSVKKVTAASVEPVALKTDNGTVAQPDKATTQSVSVEAEESKGVASGHSKCSDDKASDSVKSGLDNKESSKEKTMDEKEINALKASLEDKTNKVKELEEQVKTLKATVESKDAEAKKLNTDVADAKTLAVKDYATLVAHYRIVLEKPDTKGLDSEEAKTGFIDMLCKRSLDSLRDSLSDLKLEVKTVKTPEKSGQSVDVSKDKLSSPVLHNGKGSDSKIEKPSAKAELDKLLNDGD